MSLFFSTLTLNIVVLSLLFTPSTGLPSPKGQLFTPLSWQITPLSLFWTQMGWLFTSSFELWAGPFEQKAPIIWAQRQPVAVKSSNRLAKSKKIWAGSKNSGARSQRNRNSKLKRGLYLPGRLSIKLKRAGKMPGLMGFLLKNCRKNRCPLQRLIIPWIAVIYYYI